MVLPIENELLLCPKNPSSGSYFQNRTKFIFILKLLKQSIIVSENSRMRNLSTKDFWVEGEEHTDRKTKIGNHLDCVNTFFKGCLPQIILGPFLNTLTKIDLILHPRSIKISKLSVCFRVHDSGMFAWDIVIWMCGPARLESERK